MVKGIVLNKDGYTRFPTDIFGYIEEDVAALNWRISNVECVTLAEDYEFPFEKTDDFFIAGEDLLAMLRAHSAKQWIWGVLSGFPRDVEWEQIKKKPVIDVYEPGILPHMKNGIRHIEPDAVLEIIAIDSTETHVLADSDSIIDRLMQAFPKAESLEKYVE